MALPVLGLQGQTDREAAESLIRSVFSRWEQEQKASLLLSAGKVERDQMETKQKRTRKNPKKLKIWKMEWITNKRMDVVLTYAGFRPFDRQVHRASKQTKLWKLQLTRASNRYGWSILSLELLRPREGLFYPFRRSKRVL